MTPKVRRDQCETCDGCGTVYQTRFRWRAACDDCDGAGYTDHDGYACSRCGAWCDCDVSTDEYECICKGCEEEL